MGKNNSIKKENKECLIETPKRIYNKRAGRMEEVLSNVLGEKYVAYRKKWVKVSKRELITPFPLYIQIEHVGKCNLQCPICIQGIPPIREDYSRGFGPLDIELYKKILSEAKRYECPSISFHNNDEPLLLSELEYRIRLAKRAGFLDIILTTNATLLHKNRAKALLESGITKINFSIDAFNVEDYKKRRRGGDFNTVLKNIEYFIEQREKAKLKLPITRVTCVLTKDSVKGMNLFRRFWKNKVDIVEFQNFQAIKGYTEHLRPDRAVLDTNFICNGPWQQVVIRANGDVLPCCSFYGAGMIVGNIRESSIYDIWNSKSMSRIRKELLKNNFKVFQACKKCSETFYSV